MTKMTVSIKSEKTSSVSFNVHSVHIYVISNRVVTEPAEQLTAELSLSLFTSFGFSFHLKQIANYAMIMGWWVSSFPSGCTWDIRHNAVDPHPTHPNYYAVISVSQ